MTITLSAIVIWLLIGLVVGGLAHLLVPGRNRIGIILTIGVGIVGAIVGGFIGSKLGLGGVDGFNLWSILLAVIGAVIVLVIYNAVARRA